MPYPGDHNDLLWFGYGFPYTFLRISCQRIRGLTIHVRPHGLSNATGDYMATLQHTGKPVGIYNTPNENLKAPLLLLEMIYELYKCAPRKQNPFSEVQIL